MERICLSTPAQAREGKHVSGHVPDLERFLDAVDAVMRELGLTSGAPSADAGGF